jgi:hypothetical protein
LNRMDPSLPIMTGSGGPEAPARGTFAVRSRRPQIAVATSAAAATAASVSGAASAAAASFAGAASAANRAPAARRALALDELPISSLPPTSSPLLQSTLGATGAAYASGAASLRPPLPPAPSAPALPDTPFAASPASPAQSLPLPLPLLPPPTFAGDICAEWRTFATESLLGASAALDRCMKSLPALQRSWDVHEYDGVDTSLLLRDLALTLAALERALCAFATQQFPDQQQQQNSDQQSGSSSSSSNSASQNRRRRDSAVSSDSDDSDSTSVSHRLPRHDWRFCGGLVPYLLLLRRVSCESIIAPKEIANIFRCSLFE